MQDVTEQLTGKGLDVKHADVMKLNSQYRRMRTLKRIISYIVLSIIGIYSIFPIYYVIMTSLSPLQSISFTNLGTMVPFGHTLNLNNYYDILFRNPFLLWMGNTLLLTTTSTLIGVGLSVTTGLVFSRFRIPGKKALLYMLLIISMFPFGIMVIPFYFMFSQLHLLNSYLGLIIPYSAGAVIFASWLIKNYVDGIPKDYEEAAMLDGYTRSGALFRVLIPIAKPAVLFSLVLAFMGPYTDYALAGQFLTSPGKYTMAIGMYYVSQQTMSMSYGTFSAFAVLMGIPLFVVFFVFQKYLVSGFSLATYK